MLALTIDGITEHLNETELEGAMQRYWMARSQGDQTAQLIKVEFGPSDPEPEDDPPPSAPGAIMSVAQERIAIQEKWIEEAGFSMPQPVFAPGARLTLEGERNFRLERQRVEAMPLFPEAAARVREQIADECRENVSTRLRSLSMNNQGELLMGGDTLGMEVSAFAQLAMLSGFGSGTRYLTKLCPRDLRAENFNRQARLRPDRELVLRTRLGPDGGRRAFATVTPTYSAVDTDQVLLAVEHALTDAHTEMRYDGAGVRATAMWMPDQIVDQSAGDVFKVGVRIETDDTGRGRIRISGVAFRPACLNLLIISEGKVETVSLVHRGDPERILSIVRDGVDEAREKVGTFLEAWGHARTVKVDVQELLREWVEEKSILPRTRMENDVIVEELLCAWRKEPGDSLADAINALSRSAHESDLWDMDFREEMERQAARLVLVPR